MVSPRVLDLVPSSSGMLAVELRDGLVFGRGIPYATADRFDVPVAIDSPSSERDATKPGPICPQNRLRFEFVVGAPDGDPAQGEDCLVLSVTAPANARDLPVMVWFHGGAYLAGSGESPKFEADDLAREGVVVVRVTYRLGVLGYLPPEGVGQDNLGLLDQIEALRWVSNNIAGFGGNPKSITVFGQSAGADSVLCLLTCVESRDLIHRAIVQSPPMGSTVGREVMMAAARREFTKRLGPQGLDASVEVILEAQAAAKITAETFGQVSGMPFAPLAGSSPLPTGIHARLAEIAGRVELLTGYTKDDAAPFVMMDPRSERLAPLGKLGLAIRRRITAKVTEQIFNPRPLIDIWNDAGGKVASYRFDWAPDHSELGACHCIELPAIFSGDWSNAPMLADQEVPPELATEVRRTWAQFAKHGVAGLDSTSLVFV